MLERTKRPTVVSAGQFIKLTYESFVMVSFFFLVYAE